MERASLSEIESRSALCHRRLVCLFDHPLTLKKKVKDLPKLGHQIVDWLYFMKILMSLRGHKMQNTSPVI